ncbi:MAG: hypothetical protein ACJ8F1_02800 [Polyangia bacterium]
MSTPEREVAVAEQETRPRKAAAREATVARLAEPEAGLPAGTVATGRAPAAAGLERAVPAAVRGQAAEPRAAWAQADVAGRVASRELVEWSSPVGLPARRAAA